MRKNSASSERIAARISARVNTSRIGLALRRSRIRPIIDVITWTGRTCLKATRSLLSQESPSGSALTAELGMRASTSPAGDETTGSEAAFSTDSPVDSRSPRSTSIGIAMSHRCRLPNVTFVAFKCPRLIRLRIVSSVTPSIFAASCVVAITAMTEPPLLVMSQDINSNHADISDPVSWINAVAQIC